MHWDGAHGCNNAKGKLESFPIEDEIHGVDVGIHSNNLVERELQHIHEQEVHASCCFGRTKKVDWLVYCCFQ